MLVLAHAGHWLVSLIYLVPVAAVLAMVARDRLKGAREAEPPPEADADPPVEDTSARRV